MDSTTTLPIRRLRTGDAEALGDFLEAVAGDAEASRLFQPHPMTRAFAHELCRTITQRRDRYYALWHGGRVAAYCLLRGWDEGYAVPSFGACTHPGLRDAGLGQWLLAFAIEECQALGVEQLRLTVFRDNARAIHVYSKLGFELSPLDDRRLLGMLRLAAARKPSLRAPDVHRLDAWARQHAA